MGLLRIWEVCSKSQLFHTMPVRNNAVLGLRLHFTDLMFLRQTSNERGSALCNIHFEGNIFQNKAGLGLMLKRESNHKISSKAIIKIWAGYLMVRTGDLTLVGGEGGK